MAEYIERDKLYKHFEKSVTIHEATINGSTYPVYLADHVLHEIRNAPAADVVEVKHGEWKKTDWAGVSVKGYMACSQCNVMIPTCNGTRYCLNHLYYCPNCGAKMDGENK